MKRFLYISILLLALTGSLYSQIGYLQIIPQSYPGHNIAMFDTIHFRVKIKYTCNYNLQLDRYVFIKFQVNGNPQIGETHPLKVPELHLYPGQDTSDVIVDIPVTPSVFIFGGGHTVVIWPVAAGPGAFPVLPLDSVIIGDNIVVNGYFGVEKKDANDQISFFPNPAKESINISTTLAETLDRVKIIGLDGKVLIDRQFKSGDFQNIRFGDLPSGIYSALIYTSDGSVYKKKFVIN